MHLLLCIYYIIENNVKLQLIYLYDDLSDVSSSLSSLSSEFVSQVGLFEFREDPVTGDPQYRKSGADTWNFFKHILSTDIFMNPDAYYTVNLGYTIETLTLNCKANYIFLAWANSSSTNSQGVDIYDFRKMKWAGIATVNLGGSHYVLRSNLNDIDMTLPWPVNNSSSSTFASNVNEQRIREITFTDNSTSWKSRYYQYGVTTRIMAFGYK